MAFELPNWSRVSTRLLALRRGVIRSDIWNLANLPALVAIIGVSAGAVIAERMNAEMFHQRMRADLQHEADLVASKLQGLIVANTELVRGLASTIATEPYMNQRRFEGLAQSLFHNKSQLRNIAAAPDLVVSLVHPLKGNEQVLGLDYRAIPAQRAVAMQAMETGETTLAGPINLVQGGQGFIIRIPISIDDPFLGKQFWGIVSAVIDKEKLLRDSGLLTSSSASYALVGKDASGPSGAHFFGNPMIAESAPVRTAVNFGIGSWELQAVPQQGWRQAPDNLLYLRLMILAGCLVVVLPIAYVGCLSRERMTHLKHHLTNQQKLARINRRLEMAVAISRIGFWEFNTVTRKVYWDDQVRMLFGLGPQEHISEETWGDYLHPEDRENALDEAQQTIDTGKIYRAQYRIIRKDGEVRHIRAVGSVLVNERGEKLLTGVDWDVTQDVNGARELQEAKARIEANALHDFLTGLPNRRYLDAVLKGEMGGFVKMSDDIHLLKIDLDGFKEINDQIGHAAGDDMLIRMADLLNGLTEIHEFAARIGGDEFVIVCSTEKDIERPQRLAQQIIDKMQVPIHYRGRVCRLGASVGIADGRSAKGDVDRLLSNADLALYRSKHGGKGCFTCFTDQLFQTAQTEKNLADDILRGIENREFVAFYQGQYCPKSYKLCGAEALVRWNHPQKGMLPPVVFLDMAEKLGVMADIDAMVLEDALQARANWRKADLDVARVSVNVSAKRLGDENLINTLKELPIEPHSLVFELVESTFLDRSDGQVAKNIEAIKAMDIDIEIDDFGTAYASIVSLTHLMPKRLKIDRELIMPITESAHQRELVQSIIQIGKTLGIETVAEGIETMTHAEIMQVLGADVLQGFAFSRPMSAEDFLKDHKEANHKENNAVTAA